MNVPAGIAASFIPTELVVTGAPALGFGGKGVAADAVVDALRADIDERALFEWVTSGGSAGDGQQKFTMGRAMALAL